MKFLERLPFELCCIVKEYADPLYSVKKDIENKRYNLDDLMYEKMKIILKRHFKEKNTFLVDFQKYTTINKDTMNEVQYKGSIIKYYKKYYLSKIENTFRKDKLIYDIMQTYELDNTLCNKLGCVNHKNYYEIWRQL
jgi:hypothetical protein